MKERIIILGAGVMQGPAIRIAREMGLFTVVLDADPQAPWVSQADRFEQIDLKDKEGIEAFARSLKSQGGLSGIMTAGTDFSASVAWVAERIGLPGIPYEAALNASDKQRMRSCFEKAGVPSPAFTVLTGAPRNKADSVDFLPFPYPVVVKPVDNMGSRGCRRVDSPSELGVAVGEALGFSRSGRVIVESYMDGPEFSVDAIVYHGEITICGLADRHIFFPPYFIEMGHTMPTRFPREDQRALLDTFTQAVRSLGIAGENSSGAAKGDVKLSSQGPMIGEVAARLSGGYMSGWTYPYASGVEPIRAAIQMAVGRRPEGLSPSRSWTCAERAFISIPGRVRSIQGLEEAKAVPGVRDIFLRAEPGKEVRFPENNVTKCGNVLAADPGREEAAGAAEKAARSILIRLEAPNAETRAFLEGSGPQAPGGPAAFPPDAFTLGAGLRSALEKLPDPAPEGSGDLSLVPFPEFLSSGLEDYAGRGAAESLDAVRRITGLPLPLAGREIGDPSGTAHGAACGLADQDTGGGGKLGRAFWKALIRGGYQGAVYFLDDLLRRRI
ncbi:MAG: ATP-grasp domain-containing protein [Treponema sp.]|jgi:biotin carboxylase|nr:ATP-grasp domain-containing protein [Treponema sp.]